ncbi:hypothetical protein [Parabacteroides sp.]
MRHYTFYKATLLTLALLAGLAGKAWGQTTYTITKAKNTETVHTRTQIIYVDKERELYIPELRINRTEYYNWYVHWYVKGSGTIQHKTVTIKKNEASIRGGSIGDQDQTTKNVLKNETTNGGIFWSKALDTNSTNNPQFGFDASTITYTLPTNLQEGEQVICDISNNKDEELNSNNYKEPTLLKRYVFEIKPAKDIVGKTDTFKIDYPKGSHAINFSMPSIPQNYFWETSGSYKQGESFIFSIGSESGTYKNFYLSKGNNQFTDVIIPSLQVQQIDLSSYNNPVTI